MPGILAEDAAAVVIRVVVGDLAVRRLEVALHVDAAAVVVCPVFLHVDAVDLAGRVLVHVDAAAARGVAAGDGALAGLGARGLIGLGVRIIARLRIRRLASPSRTVLEDEFRVLLHPDDMPVAVLGGPVPVQGVPLQVDSDGLACRYLQAVVLMSSCVVLVEGERRAVRRIR